MCTALEGDAQPSNVDSILQRISTLDPDTVPYWESTVDLAHYYVYRDLKKAETTIESVFSGYIDKGGIFSECYHRHHLIRAWVHHGNNRLTEAVKHISKAEAIVRTCENRKEAIEISINKASLLVGMKDPSARSYVETYMSKVDTSLNRSEKIAWILGKKYLGDIDEAKRFYKTALGHYTEVYTSGVLKDIPEYRIGITKGIARAAAEIGDYDYSVESLSNLVADKSLFTYQANDIKTALAINYLKKGEIGRAYEISEEVLASDNVTTQDKIKAGWIRVKTYLSKDEKDKAGDELGRLLAVSKDVQDPALLAKVKLLQAEVSSRYGTREKTNRLIDAFLQEGDGSVDQKLKAEKLWISNNASDKIRDRLNTYLVEEEEVRSRKTQAQLQEIMAAHKVEQERQKNQLLDQKLQSATKLNRQRMITIFFLGFSAILASMLWLMTRRKSRVQEELNHLVQKEKQRIKEERDRLAINNEELIFKNQELEEINKNLRNARSAHVQTQESKIEIKARNKIHMLPLSKIIYVKAEMEGARLFLEDESSIWTSASVKSFVESYSDNGIVLIYRGVAININHIEWVNTSTVKMDNGVELKVGRTYKQDVIDMIARRR